MSNLGYKGQGRGRGQSYRRGGRYRGNKIEFRAHNKNQSSQNNQR